MKKTIMVLVLFILLISSSVQALDWAYSFVVWKGNVYEVKTEEIVKESRIGESIGSVNTEVNDRNGRYYGNASNAYPKGTKYYYEIEGFLLPKQLQ